MKAVRIHTYGSPDVLVYEEVPRPTPNQGEVLVKVHASSLNPVDGAMRTGYMQERLKVTLPFSLGFDFAGMIEEVGSGVNNLTVGEAVFGFAGLMSQGAYAEYVAVEANKIAPKPSSLEFTTAASIPLAALTAWQGLFDIGGLQAGQSVLIHGAGGGVGSFAVQFAVANGAHVIGTAGTDKQSLLKELGVSQAIDYKTTTFEEVVKEVDVVFDAVGGELTGRSLNVLKPGGILVTPVGQPDPEAAKARGVRATFMLAQPKPEQLGEIAALIEEGKVKPVVSAVLPLADIKQAHSILEAGHLRGKIVLEVIRGLS